MGNNHMSTQYPYLRRQGKKGILQFLRIVPKEIIGTEGHKEYFNNKVREKKSMKTTHEEIALPIYFKLNKDFDRRVALAKGEVLESIEAINYQVNVIPVSNKVSAGELNRIKEQFFSMQVNDVRNLLMKAKTGDKKALSSLNEQSDNLGELATAYEAFSNGAPHLLRRLQSHDYEGYINEVAPYYWKSSRDWSEREMAQEEGLKFSVATEAETEKLLTNMNLDLSERDKLLFHLNEVEHKVADYFQELRIGNFSNLPKTEFLSNNDEEGKDDITILELLGEFLEVSTLVSQGWLNKVNANTRRFVEYLGKDAFVSDIKKRDVQKFVYKLSDFPKNATQKFSNLSFNEILRENAKLNYQRLSYTTIKDGYLASLSILFSYAEKMSYIDHVPTFRISVPGQEQHRISKEDPFEIVELNKIFKQSIYTGCKSKKRRYMNGDLIIKDELYWVPLVALYTGMRAEEIAGIKVSNIHFDTDCSYINLVEWGGFTFKNKNASRKIPILKTLTDMGFMEFCLLRKEAGYERLFELWKSTNNKYANGAVIRRFNDTITPRVLDEIYNPDHKDYDKTKTRPKSFHSFRKNFITRLEHLNVNESFINQMVGHSNTSVKRRYIGKQSIQQLYAVVKDIDYDGLVFDHLLME